MKKTFICKVLAVLSVVTMSLSSIAMAILQTPEFVNDTLKMRLGSMRDISTITNIEKEKHVDIKNSNPSVITIREDGMMKAISTGITTLSYTYEDLEGEPKTIKCHIEVSKDTGTFSPVNGEVATKIDITLDCGDYVTIIKSPQFAIPTYPEVKKEGYVLEGWYKDPEFITKVGKNEKFSKNTTLYAKWITSEEANQNKVYHSSLYNDIDNHWAINAIENVSYAGLFNGVAEKMFGPDKTMTRAMVITVLGRLDDVEKTGRKSSFIDVPEGSYYEEYVAWGVENKIVSGTSETNFSPDKEITREEMAVMMANYIKFKNYKYEIEDIDFSDEDEISSWALESIKILNNLKIMTGNTDGSYNPKKVATRAEIATVFYNYINYINRVY